jgi:hypothetical protein
VSDRQMAGMLLGEFLTVDVDTLSEALKGDVKTPEVSSASARLSHSGYERDVWAAKRRSSRITPTTVTKE